MLWKHNNSTLDDGDRFYRTIRIMYQWDVASNRAKSGYSLMLTTQENQYVVHISGSVPATITIRKAPLRRAEYSRQSFGRHRGVWVSTGEEDQKLVLWNHRQQVDGAVASLTFPEDYSAILQLLLDERMGRVCIVTTVDDARCMHVWDFM